LRDNEHLLGIEAELLFDLLAVVGFEWVAVDTTGALEFGTETNRGRESDHGRLVLDLFGFLDGSFDAVVIVVAIFDPLCVPSVGFESFRYVFGEGDLGVAV
jgi:hypothetical protein